MVATLISALWILLSLLPACPVTPAQPTIDAGAETWLGHMDRPATDVRR
jgi:hypothetical protein